MRRLFLAYSLLVYSLLASLAAILLLLASQISEVRTSAVLVGIAVELLGAAVIFFLVDRVLRLREFDTATLIEEAVSRLEQQSRFLKSPEQNPAFNNLIKGAKQISLLGNSLVRLLRAYEAHLKQALDSGATLRLIFLDPEGTGCVALERDSGRAAREAILSSIRVAIDLERYTTASGSGLVEIKLLDWPTSMGFHIIDPKERHGYIRATLYAPDVSSPLSDRSHFILRPDTDPHWFNVYARQYEQLWKRAQSIPDSLRCSL